MAQCRYASGWSPLDVAGTGLLLAHLLGDTAFMADLRPHLESLELFQIEVGLQVHQFAAICQLSQLTRLALSSDDDADEAISLISDEMVVDITKLTHLQSLTLVSDIDDDHLQALTTELAVLEHLTQVKLESHASCMPSAIEALVYFHPGESGRPCICHLA